MNRHRTDRPRLYVSAERLAELRAERDARRQAEIDAALERIRQRPARPSVWGRTPKGAA
jgi:hypothetical protein